ncbi:MAG: discoidin domain-containing protein [Deltaproteobacteria bacterium]
MGYPDQAKKSLHVEKEEMSSSSADPVDQESGTRQERHRSGTLRRLLMVSLYVVFLLAVVVGTLAALEYYAYLQVKGSPLGAAYKGRDLDLARRSSQKVAPQFGYEPTPGFVAVRNTRLGNSYEYINNESFKDFKDVPLDKPADEYRVFVTGGSVVYGRGPVPPADAVTEYYEVTFRWTIPHIMEKLLNADPRVREKIGGKKVRVINAGVAGHVIQNDLMRYLAKLRLYKPDLVVSLDGANEVHTVARPLKDWNYFTEGPYYEVIGEIMDMGPSGLLNYLTLWLKRNTYFFSWLAMERGEGPGILMENRGFAAHPQDPTPEMIAYRDRNIAQVADVLAIYHKVLETDGVPHVLALQPMFRNCKKKRTPMERRIEQVTGMEKIGFYDAAETYDVLVKKVKKRAREAGFEALDLTGIFDNVNAWVFTDWCHVTNGANYIMAKALVNAVKTRVFNLPLLPDDQLKPPLDSYFVDYAKQAKVLVDGRLADRGMHILKGYPGKAVLQVQPDGKGDPPSVVLDLGKVVPVSRLRIVWGDEKSVPKGWKVDVSEDDASWKNWITMKNTRVDPYDQWPGFEYYAEGDTPARFVRYQPLGADANGTITLRQLSLFR